MHANKFFAPTTSTHIALKQPIQNHLHHEHEQIDELLQDLKLVVFSGLDTVEQQIEFRTGVQRLAHLLQVHFTGEERVVLRYLDEHAETHLQHRHVKCVCETNQAMDEVLLLIDETSWNRRGILQTCILSLIRLFELHVMLEEKQVFLSLEGISSQNQKELLSELISTEHQFEDWLISVETAPTESLVH